MPGYAETAASIQEGIRRLEGDLQQILNCAADTRGALSCQLAEVNSQLRSAREIIAKESVLEYSRKRIEEIRADASNAAAALEAIEKMLFLTEEYTRFKARFVEDSINSLFTIARFRLFREQANGGLEERCDVVYEGVPYIGLNKQYTDEDYTRLNNSLVRRIGTLNCGHSAMPVILGVNEPQYTDEELEEMRRKNEDGVTYNGKHYTLYEAEQRQHKLERAIRERKHRILIDEHLGDTDKLQTDQIRLQLLKQEYSRFSKAAGLPMQYERMEAAGFTWKHGKAAERTESRFHETVERIGRSVGAKAKNYKVYNPVTGEELYLSEGTRITQPKNHVMAGKGRERQIDELQLLLDKYGGDPLEWTKEKGYGYVDDEFGESHLVELHWYQEPTAGRVKMKIKIQPDGRIYLDEE